MIVPLSASPDGNVLSQPFARDNPDAPSLMKCNTTAESNGEIIRFYAIFASSQFMIDAAIWSYYLVEHCGLSLTQAAVFYAGVTAVSGALDIPTGSLADRLGRRWVVAFGFFFASNCCCTDDNCSESPPPLRIRGVAALGVSNEVAALLFKSAQEIFFHYSFGGQSSSFFTPEKTYCGCRSPVVCWSFLWGPSQGCSMC